MARHLTTLTVCTALLLSAGAGTAFAQTRDGFPYTQRHQQHYPAGYHVNRMGYGNYRPGPDGSFGGYPAGSDGAKILQYQQQKKCQYAPESC